MKSSKSSNVPFGLLHSVILKEIIDKGIAPAHAQLTTYFNTSEESMNRALDMLQEQHGLVLHPNSYKIWVIHPFSLAPTNFFLRGENQGWWSNCAWCSLGAASLINKDLTISTTIGGEDKAVRIQIKNGQIQNNDLLVHFPIPMSKAWDNVIYTCSMMLFFENEEQIDHWCATRNIKKGDIQPIEKIWEFARSWYGQHLDEDWKKWTTEEARKVFKEYGLDHPIWKIERGNSRF